MRGDGDAGAAAGAAKRRWGQERGPGRRGTEAHRGNAGARVAAAGKGGVPLRLDREGRGRGKRERDLTHGQPRRRRTLFAEVRENWCWEGEGGEVGGRRKERGVTAIWALPINSLNRTVLEHML